MTNKETDEAAERQKRLQALRSKQKEQAAKPRSGSDSDTSDRKREVIKKIMKKRMQEGGTAGAGGASGKNAGQFPRLKALLEQGGGQTGETSSVKLEKLEARVVKLEQALEKALKMFAKKKK